MGLHGAVRLWLQSGPFGQGSAEIAKSAGLHERYVHEWLAALTTGGIVHNDPEAMTFSLPPEHASLLTHSGEDDLGVDS